VPVVKFTGNMSVGYVLIDWNAAHRISGMKRVGVGSALEFENNAILETSGLIVDVYKKMSDGLDANGNIKANAKPEFQVTDCYMDSEDFNISEGSAGDHNQTFRYLTPIFYAAKGVEEGVDVSAFDRSIR